MRTLSQVLTVLLALALAVACDNPNQGGGGTPVQPPSINCSPDITITGVPAPGQIVLFPTPVVTNGTPPVTAACVPANGSNFPIGTTTVTCTATDAIARSAQCQFHVTLVAQKLAAMTFMAFGDSITAGENGIDADDPETAQPCALPATSAQAPGIIPRFIDTPNSYPVQLMTMLQSRFPGQTFTLIKEGLRGETAVAGHQRLVQCLPIYRPDVLLLLEGVNDLVGFGKTPTAAQEQQIVDALQMDVRDASVSNFVFVSTILPVIECEGCRGDLTSNAAIDQTNGLIRSRLVGATIVESNILFKASDPSLLSLLESDGLHPTPAGYTVLARAFETAIVNRIPITSLRRRR